MKARRMQTRRYSLDRLTPGSSLQQLYRRAPSQALLTVLWLSMVPQLPTWDSLGYPPGFTDTAALTGKVDPTLASSQV